MRRMTEIGRKAAIQDPGCEDRLRVSSRHVPLTSLIRLNVRKAPNVGRWPVVPLSELYLAKICMASRSIDAAVGIGSRSQSLW